MNLSRSHRLRNWIQASLACLLLPSLVLWCGGAEVGLEMPDKDPNFPNLPSIVARAKAGEAAAQTKLGDYFYAQSNFTNAAVWYHRAAKQGHAPAQNSLADCYRTGRGVAKNLQEANQWSRLALHQVADPKPSIAPEIPTRTDDDSPEPKEEEEEGVAGKNPQDPDPIPSQSSPEDASPAITLVAWVQFLQTEGNGPLTQRILELESRKPVLEDLPPMLEAIESPFSPSPARSGDVAKNLPR